MVKPATWLNWTTPINRDFRFATTDLIFLTFAQKSGYRSCNIITICIIITSAPNGFIAIVKKTFRLPDGFFATTAYAAILLFRNIIMAGGTNLEGDKSKWSLK